MAGFGPSAASLPALLIADSAGLLFVAIAARLRRDRDWRNAMRGATAYLIMLTAYAAVGAMLVSYPMHWLRSDASLGVALAISAAAVLALLALWRLWPAFGLAGMDARHRWCKTQSGARKRLGYLATARKLTADNEVFFGHGLLASLALFGLTQGALVLSEVGVPIATGSRPVALVVYAVSVLPLTWIVVHCVARALLIDRQRLRAEREVFSNALAQSTPLGATLGAENAPDDLGTLDLDAMLLRCVRTGQTQLALAALDHGANPNCVPSSDDRDQRSALVMAVLNPDMRLLRGFIAKGADLQAAHAGLPLLIAATRDSR